MANTVDKVLKIAADEVGYLEKASGANLYDKTANAGHNNYTKYGKEMHEVYPSVMDYPAAWCDAFVDWCFYKAYGIATAKGLLNGNFNDYTVASAQQYKKKGAWHTSDPQVGDQVFFKNNVRICHTGIVYAVDANKIYTIEGNTSGANGVVANGGGVCKKSYNKTYSKIAGYGRPKYDVETLSKPDSTPVKVESNPVKVDSARSKDSSLAGTYVTTADLWLRRGAGSSKAGILVMPRGAKVTCYGYYTEYNGTKWYLVAYKGNTGFASSKYLKK